MGGREGVRGEEQQRTVLDEYGRWGRGRGAWRRTAETSSG